MDRAQEFLQVAAEAVNEAADALAADNARWERKRQANHVLQIGAAMLGQLRDATPEEASEIIYRHYKQARNEAPLHAPIAFGALFGADTPALEARYQRERA